MRGCDTLFSRKTALDGRPGAMKSPEKERSFFQDHLRVIWTAEVGFTFLWFLVFCMVAFTVSKS